MQKVMYFDQTRCTGCFACEVACKDWHDTPAGPAKLIWITTNERGIYPSLHVSFLIHLCNHCVEPNCVVVCPVHAITKRKKEGIVVVDTKKCIGRDLCQGLCLKACPYKAPQFGAEQNPRMQKCDFCLDRWKEGKKPICVASCPTRALDAGTAEEICKMYGKTNTAEGFKYSSKLKPAIIFKPKNNGGAS